MLTLRTAQHIATSRTIPSFRSCRTHAGSRIWSDQGRIGQGQAQRLTQEARRQWLKGQWRT
ncbi:MAG: hypothetical protein ACFCVD_06810 [Nodosilinea sp.]